MDVYLNKEHPEKAYHCGRLLAVLAFTQEQALGKVNAGVVRRNMGSVMAMPGLMLGRLEARRRPDTFRNLRATYRTSSTTNSRPST